MMIGLLTIIARFALTFFLTLLFGLERQKFHKPIGFGTFTFVSLGSCAVGVIASSNGVPGSLPLLGATITGIGFLGAGALVKGTDKVFGFTTASAIWLFAIFGLITGIGEYTTALLTYSFVWGIVLLDKYFEQKGFGSYQKKVTITAKASITEKEMADYVLSHLDHARRYRLVSFEADKKGKKVILVCFVRSSIDNIHHIVDKLLKEKWVYSCRIE